MLTVSVFLYCLIVFLEEKAGLKSEVVSAVMLLLGLTVILMGPYIGTLTGLEKMWFLYPLGVKVDNVPGQADYLPLFPWLGVFMTGAVAGRTLYRCRHILPFVLCGPDDAQTRTARCLVRGHLLELLS